MRFREGQRVMVHPDIVSMNKKESPGINESMIDMAGQIITIGNTDDSFMKTRYYAKGWSWLEKWLLPLEMKEDEAFELLVKGKLSEREYKEVTRTT